MIKVLAPIALVALFVCGCGGTAGTTAGNGRTHPVHPRAGRFQWLVRTTGPQPAIATENRNPGTTAWRLSGPAAETGGARRGLVSGYVSQPAVRPGVTERIYVDAHGARRVSIRIFRIGWYGGNGGREVLASGSLRAVKQPPCAHQSATGLTECAWHQTLSFKIPEALPTGVYIAKLSATTGESDCLFVVRDLHQRSLLAQLPTSTYQAYNAWGGDSLYPGGADRVGLTGTTQGVAVSYDRPYDSLTGAGQFFARDVAMVRFLERYGYPVSYTTSESVDAHPDQLRGYRAVIDFGHSEYWSGRQEAAFALALQHGTSLLFFGSDALAWRIRYAPASRHASQPGTSDRTIIAYKEHPALDHSRAATVFRDRGAALTGAAYLGCITPRVRQPGPPVYRYYPWAPAATLTPSWLFAGTGITAATRIPGIVGYELDQRIPQSRTGTEVVGGGAAACMAVAERGGPFPGRGQERADTTLYTAPSGAIVFDSGTLGWELGLEPVPSASPDAPRAPDPRIVAMTRNLLAHAALARDQRPGR
jgi:hypothetical protein